MRNTKSYRRMECKKEKKLILIFFLFIYECKLLQKLQCKSMTWRSTLYLYNKNIVLVIFRWLLLCTMQTEKSNVFIFSFNTLNIIKIASYKTTNTQNLIVIIILKKYGISAHLSPLWNFGIFVNFCQSLFLICRKFAEL